MYSNSIERASPGTRRVAAALTAVALTLSSLASSAYATTANEFVASGGLYDPAGAGTTTLSGANGAGLTTLAVANSAGLSAGDLVIIDKTSTAPEVVRVTAIPDGTDLTVVRAQQGTTAKAFTGGEKIFKLGASAANFALQFQAATGVAAGGTVTVDIPANFTTTSLVDGDITVTSDNSTPIAKSGAAVFTNSNHTVVITFSNAIAVNDVVTVKMANTHVVAPSSDPNQGVYAVALHTTTSTGAVADTGYALVNAGNSVSVSATVAEALVMTLNSSALNISVDPSINGGRDNAESSVITVASNAYDGFTIKARLRDSSGTSDQLKGAAHGATITSAGSGGVNYFKFSTTPASGLSANTVNSAVTATAAAYSGDTVAYTSGNGGTNTVNAGTVTVNYDLLVDYTKPADTYAGTITYTAYPTF